MLQRHWGLDAFCPRKGTNVRWQHHVGVLKSSCSAQTSFQKSSGLRCGQGKRDYKLCYSVRGRRVLSQSVILLDPQLRPEVGGGTFPCWGWSSNRQLGEKQRWLEHTLGIPAITMGFASLPLSDSKWR
ncbi:unnamed protein product [Eretmochelys imbricata]